MLKKDWKLVIACIAFFSILYISHISFPSIWRTNSKKSPSIEVQDAAREFSDAEPNKFSQTVWQSSHLSQMPFPEPISCNRSHPVYDTCTINGPTLLDPRISTFFTLGPSSPTIPPIIEKIRPYPRKIDNSTMAQIEEITISSGPSSPHCEVYHNAPAIVFSVGGHDGKLFHEFDDGFVPLFVTVNSMMITDQEFVLVILDANDVWVNRYAKLLASFSKYPIIYLESDRSTHCFTWATIGLVWHGSLSIDPNLLPISKTLSHFQALLGTTYNGQHHPSVAAARNKSSGPRIVLLGRGSSEGSMISNQAQLKEAAQNIGFDMVVFEPTPSTSLHAAYEVLNSSHAMIGVHGAEFTHLLFLRPGSVVVQVVPSNTERTAGVFEKPARDLGLQYMEYRMGVEENLGVKNQTIEEKDRDDELKPISLKEETIQLDLVKFGRYLKRAYRKAKRFMAKDNVTQKSGL
ncbi:Glycosyltransferase 61 [Dillenia turbinata]|uniref:Glycosyltransferase 61 n=1 Tax=Dillenia turbinata TaxID=194707 RepID=A0AAN8VD67_9MAGN